MCQKLLDLVKALQDTSKNMHWPRFFWTPGRRYLVTKKSYQTRMFSVVLCSTLVAVRFGWLVPAQQLVGNTGVFCPIQVIGIVAVTVTYFIKSIFTFTLTMLVVFRMLL